MKIKSRISSILKAKTLDFSVIDFPTFQLSELKLEGMPDFELPNNLRLGHLAEKVVSGLINTSSNFEVVYENVQIKKDNSTIGELDFILENLETKQLIHLELAYKFYLFDPSLSSKEINCWIGPNRNDSLHEKLDKLKTKQFPLLYYDCAKKALEKVEISEVTQKLCLLATLFVPYEYKGNISPAFEKAIAGYYVDFETFKNLHNSNKTYFLPPKKEWGIDPAVNEIWSGFCDVEEDVKTCMEEKQSPLVWQRCGDVFSVFFVVWW